VQLPSMRSGQTQIISNERGHLLPSIPRRSGSPWGSFIGTWQTERKPIQLKTRTKLMAHLAKIDSSPAGGAQSVHSNRAVSAHASQESQGEVIGSPRPHSTDGSQRGEQSPPTSPDNAKKPSSPALSQPPASTAASGAGGSRPDTSTSEQGSLIVQSKAPSCVSSAQNSRIQSPSSNPVRSASAASTRSNRSRTPASRAQSASTRTPLHLESSIGSRSQVSSALSSIREGTSSKGRPESPQAVSGTQSPLGSARPLTTDAASQSSSTHSSRAHTAASAQGGDGGKQK